MANILHTSRKINLANGGTQIPFTCEQGLGGVELYNRIGRVIDPAVMKTKFIEREGDWIAICTIMEVTKTSDTTGFVTFEVHEFRENREYLAAQQGIFTIEDLRRHHERLELIDSD